MAGDFSGNTVEKYNWGIYNVRAYTSLPDLGFLAFCFGVVVLLAQVC
jgi:hypothetical protein